MFRLCLCVLLSLVLEILHRNVCFILVMLIIWRNTPVNLTSSVFYISLFRVKSRGILSPFFFCFHQIVFPLFSYWIRLLGIVYVFLSWKWRWKWKNGNCTILIPKGNSYCRRKSSSRGPWFKVSSEGLSAEIDIYHSGHPSKYRPRSMLLNLSVLGGWQQWNANSHWNNII